MLGVEVGQGGNQPVLRNRFLETFPEQKKCKSCAIFPTSANFQRHNMRSISSTPKLKVCMKRNSSWEFAERYYVIGVEQRKQHSWISIITITRSILQALSFVFLLPQPKKKKGARAAAEENQLCRYSWFSLQPLVLMTEFSLNPELRAAQRLVILIILTCPVLSSLIVPRFLGNWK